MRYWQNNYCLIIDKVSMVSKLSNIIDQERASQHFSSEEPFSGLSVTLISNFYWFPHVASWLLNPCNHTEDSTLAVLTCKAISWVNLLQQPQHRDNHVLTFKNPNEPHPQVPKTAGNETIVLQVFSLRTWKWLFRHNRGFKQQCSHYSQDSRIPSPFDGAGDQYVNLIVHQNRI